MRSLSFLSAAISALLVRQVAADIQITSPTASTKWTGGTTVQMMWKDDGNSPSLDQFSTFNVFLCWGSNDVPMCDQILGPASSKFSANQLNAKFQIPATVGGNGDVYFLKMETIATAGGYTWNYSPRFTLSGMTGSFSAAAIAEQKKGDTSPPNRVDTTTGATTTPAGDTGVPYTMQTGPTRYAPMQTQPGTKIKAKSASRRYPTSSVSIYKTMAPPAVAQTTITMPWTYTVTSKENTASPAPMPSDDDMARFLMRWRD
ncbi:beta-1,6-glucan boisynthesis protein-like protein [Sphaerosporella brunnea]|uniref:Beta-1,6-glucan boisynthesis protein-like protein n=1 Tax=Sphaerosporella brunnea TaxID=1250544 RepID=A0A5J5EI38_9PEZI|nr:beta-1,6-glucan boisynthesis protein-like protein [Sphaerosporella brunnea]